ncbi:MAG: alpha-1,6-mannosyltransferase [Arenicella sp.]
MSNDFYRFIWDGELMTKGVNPYAHIPNDLVSQDPFYSSTYMKMLWRGMGDLSQSNFSCYPVMNQILFVIPAGLFESIQMNVISLKVMMILGDIGAIYFGKKILEHLKKPTHLIWLYALNPFIILEFSGNLHFEGIMICFTLAGIYYVLKDKWMPAALFFVLAIHIKLIPLIFIPFLFKKLRWKNAIGFSALTAFGVIGLGMLLINGHFFENIKSSLDLYFNSFEFNASIFNLMREYSISTLGYDNIAQDGPFLSKIAFILIMVLAAVRAVREDKQLFGGFLFALVIYYLFATTVHPWYISLILIFSIFTQYKFGLIWSLLIMLTYYAYSNPDFTENMLYITLEYVLVISIMLIEIFRSTKKSSFGLQLKEFFSDK